MPVITSLKGYEMIGKSLAMVVSGSTFQLAQIVRNHVFCNSEIVENF